MTQYQSNHLIRENNVTMVDFDKVKLIPASLEQYPIIQNMGRFYVYDMSEYMGFEPGWDIPQDGLYECINFKKYWETTDAYPFLIYYEQELAGFAIVDKKGSESSINFNMAQFFILRKFKNKGIGRAAAHQCFNQFPGTWEVMVIPGNDGAYRFWHSTISNYTHHQFKEYTREIPHFNNNRKNIFYFTSQANQTQVLNSPLSITYDPNPKHDDIATLWQGITAHASVTKQHSPGKAFAFFIKDQAQKIKGGCSGYIFYSSLYIDLLWVDIQLRGKQYGSNLIEQTEKLAIANQCHFIAVNTMDFEALDFYKKLGFHIEFERAGFAKNSIMYLLRKNLESSHSA